MTREEYDQRPCLPDQICVEGTDDLKFLEQQLPVDKIDDLCNFPLENTNRCSWGNLMHVAKHSPAPYNTRAQRILGAWTARRRRRTICEYLVRGAALVFVSWYLYQWRFAGSPV